jgi:hypothetical protein
MDPRRLLLASGWVVLGLALLGMTISCIFPDQRRGGWGGGGGWHDGRGGGWHERG